MSRRTSRIRSPFRPFVLALATLLLVAANGAAQAMILVSIPNVSGDYTVDATGEGRWLVAGEIAFVEPAFSRDAQSDGPKAARLTLPFSGAGRALVEAMQHGDIIDAIDVRVLSSAQGRSTYLEFTLMGVRVTSYSVGGGATADGSIPTETVSLNFDKVLWR